MFSYVADNQSASRFIYSSIRELLILLMSLGLYNLLFSDGNLSVFIVAGYTIYFVIRIAWTERIQQVVFDHDNKEVLIHYTHYWQRKVETILFNEVKIEIQRKEAPLFQFSAEPVSIHLLKGEIEYFELNQNKDGFSLYSLEQIVEQFRSLSLPVEEKSS